MLHQVFFFQPGQYANFISISVIRKTKDKSQNVFRKTKDKSQNVFSSFAQVDCIGRFEVDSGKILGLGLR